MLAPLIEEDRSHFRSKNRCRFVTAPEFRSLMLSHRRLERVDDHQADLRGLVDLDTGAHFVIEAEKLSDSLA